MIGLTLLGQAALLAEPLRDGQGARYLAERHLAQPQGMERWPRLDRYGRALASACAIAHRTSDSRSTGLLVASERSCHETNAAFHRTMIEKEPRLASPFLFPYTLPGSAASEVAIHL